MSNKNRDQDCSVQVAQDDKTGSVEEMSDRALVNAFAKFGQDHPRLNTWVLCFFGLIRLATKSWKNAGLATFVLLATGGVGSAITSAFRVVSHKKVEGNQSRPERVELVEWDVPEEGGFLESKSSVTGHLVLREGKEWNIRIELNGQHLQNSCLERKASGAIVIRPPNRWMPGENALTIYATDADGYQNSSTVTFRSEWSLDFSDYGTGGSSDPEDVMDPSHPHLATSDVYLDRERGVVVIEPPESDLRNARYIKTIPIGSRNRITVGVRLKILEWSRDGVQITVPGAIGMQYCDGDRRYVSFKNDRDYVSEEGKRLSGKHEDRVVHLLDEAVPIGEEHWVWFTLDNGKAVVQGGSVGEKRLAEQLIDVSDISTPTTDVAIRTYGMPIEISRVVIR